MTELQQKILELREEGKTYNEIKQLLGCSKGTISYYVGLGVKEKQHRRQKVSRGKFRVKIQEIKQNSPCADCGEKYPYWVMDFDHLENKSFNISALVRERGCDMKALADEIAKCEIVCANCHRTRSHNRSKKSESKDVLDIENYYA